MLQFDQQKLFDNLVTKAGFQSLSELREVRSKQENALSESQLYAIRNGTATNIRDTTIDKLHTLLESKGNTISRLEIVNLITPVLDDKNRNDKETIPRPPEYFDPVYLEKSLKKKRGCNVKYLLIRFGSSVTSKNPRDTDYVVLVHGKASEEISRYKQGTVLKGDELLPDTFDVQVIEFDSFWAGIIKGKPFELSVALEGRVEEAHNMPEFYWDWLKTLANNILVDCPVLYNTLEDELQLLSKEYFASQLHFRKMDIDDENRKIILYNLIISGYHWACHLVQMKCLLKSDGEFTQGPTLLALSKPATLFNMIESVDGKKLFKTTVEFFKREYDPEQWINFECNFLELLTILKKEEENAASKLQHRIQHGV